MCPWHMVVTPQNKMIYSETDFSSMKLVKSRLCTSLPICPFKHNKGLIGQIGKLTWINSEMHFLQQKVAKSIIQPADPSEHLSII